ncbi:dUTP pyrophosphatase [Peptoniphilus asaccharolyticus DSM 20463]|uniref:Deoxyuridine 5'-triphosphate nucleotidohydrolase n=1 Tax=Peptoniphilus asaccharolyticus DSM 20463 TaxID=573058 RepID=A0A1W1USH7_PEPAS|nr:dUTP diphosphatase [Peptoniphilus asaccharolyticus]MBL7575098.1 dUTP diphosphatase [Peptoniphilus asaccharolyticus]SMB83684.1 dUTP pyrophosphatase [Peptoniphilus asaccharolyticus DSM 20463]
MNIKIINKSNNPTPAYETTGSAGMDIRANLDEQFILKPMSRAAIPTGLYMEIPEGYEAQVRARSGLAFKYGISLTNGIGTIDSDYRGELKVLLINLGDEDFVINNGDRIAQLVIAKYEKVEFVVVEDLSETDRNTGGFGHTGLS